jgi:hypothetical protein
MKRSALLLVLLGTCAHAPSRTGDPSAWLYVESEHFSVRTDVPEEAAKKAVADMELVRSALVDVGWATDRADAAKFSVVLLATQEELREFAAKGLLGFATSDGFGQRVLVVTADLDVVDDMLFKHELTHLLNKQFLVTKPRWVDEGIAVYQETLQIDRAHNRVTVGQPESERLQLLLSYPMKNAFSVLNGGREQETNSAEDGYKFETYAWLWVHWLTDTRLQAFEKYLGSLAHGDETWAAFNSAFPGLREADVQQGIEQYWKQKLMRASSGELRPWTGTVRARPMPKGEAIAERAELLAFHAGYEETPTLQKGVQVELARALEADPGNPLALEHLEGHDAKAAIDAHPDDWRAWLLYAERNAGGRAALDKALSLSPNNPTVLLHLAYAEGREGHMPEALRDIARAAEIAPGRTDVLDGYAQMASASGKCDQAMALEQRALDSFTDAGASGVPQGLRQRLVDIQQHCKREETIARSVLFTPVVKECKARMPRFTTKPAKGGPVKATFHMQKDGTVTGVKVAGTASEYLIAGLKKYVESCRFEPLMVDGQAQEADASVTFSEPTK